jgi:probable HAF family extracellular repeat protein
MKDLGKLGGQSSAARDINDSGHIVGSSRTSAGDAWHAFVYADGAMRDLGTLGSQDSNAYGINNVGHIVGSSSLADGSTHAFLYADGVMQDLGAFGGSSRGVDINNEGHIEGTTNVSSNLDGPRSRAFLYADGVTTDLGSLGGRLTYAGGLNDSGQVVGQSRIDDVQFHAFLYADGGITDLNSLIDPALGWTIVGAADINNNGQIAAWGYQTVDGIRSDYRALRLDLVAAVPEPANVAMLLCGLGLLGFMVRGKAGPGSPSRQGAAKTVCARRIPPGSLRDGEDHTRRFEHG